MITEQGILLLAVLGRHISDRADRCAAAEQSGLPQRARELIGEVLDQAIDARDAAAALIRERDQLKARLDTNRCNRGHVTLPLTLWDCPECHNATKQKLAELIEADKEYDAARVAFFGAKGDAIDAADARLEAAMARRRAALARVQGEGA